MCSTNAIAALRRSRFPTIPFRWNQRHSTFNNSMRASISYKHQPVDAICTFFSVPSGNRTRRYPLRDLSVRSVARSSSGLSPFQTPRHISCGLYGVTKCSSAIIACYSVLASKKQPPMTRCHQRRYLTVALAKLSTHISLIFRSRLCASRSGLQESDVGVRQNPRRSDYLPDIMRDADLPDAGIGHAENGGRVFDGAKG